MKILWGKAMKLLQSAKAKAMRCLDEADVDVKYRGSRNEAEETESLPGKEGSAGREGKTIRCVCTEKQR